MKNKKDIIKDYIEKAEESLLRIDITMKYLQNKYAESNKKAILDELSHITSEKNNTEDWLKFLKEEMENA